MAVRTGDEPPRQRLQRLLDEAVKDKPVGQFWRGRLVLHCLIQQPLQTLARRFVARSHGHVD
ncbi:hypothetical protein, partial [Aeromonas caviae]|uniref:hypothetical protein n=1 Tax=Aeromonas caviae TaxID=648 RepID=UPI001CC36CFE